jgi:DNA-binding MarR family transcriptional regulator
MFNQRPVKPEHITGVLKALSKKGVNTPKKIAEESGLTLTAVTGAISKLETDGKVRTTRQNKTPRLIVELK